MGSEAVLEELRLIPQSIDAIGWLGTDESEKARALLEQVRSKARSAELRTAVTAWLDATAVSEATDSEPGSGAAPLRPRR
jgi:hypothetical protein